MTTQPTQPDPRAKPAAGGALPEPEQPQPKRR